MTQGFPEDFYTDAYSNQDEGDDNDAANFAAHTYTSFPTEALIQGCGVSNYDSAAPSVDVDSGLVRIVDSDVNGLSKTWPKGAFVYEVNAETDVSLTDGDVNHIYVEADRSTKDTASITVNTTGTKPSETSVKVDEVDTANDTTSEQWNLVASDGILTFPSKSAASTQATSLEDGTTVFDRSGGKHYAVVAGSLKPLGAFTDPDDDGIYTLPNSSDGIAVGSVSADDADIATLEATDVLNAPKHPTRSDVPDKEGIYRVEDVDGEGNFGIIAREI
jgi:hypothetical protein